MRYQVDRLCDGVLGRMWVLMVGGGFRHESDARAFAQRAGKIHGEGNIRLVDVEKPATLAMHD